MSTKKAIVGQILEWFPAEDALSYDNVGVLAGDINGDARKVMLALDVTSSVVSEAAAQGCDLLITHHPLIFGGIKNVNCDNATGKLLWQLGGCNIPYMAVHTNLDVADNDSNAVLAQILGCESWTSDEGVDCGVIADIKPATLSEFASSVKEKLGGTGVIYYDDPAKVCTKAFIQGGSFDEESIPAIKRAGVDVVVSGEIKHHIMNELSEYGISGIIAGHRETESVFIPHLAEKLQKAFPDVEFLVSL